MPDLDDTPPRTQMGSSSRPNSPTPIPSLPNHINNNSKRPRSSSPRPHPFVPGSPTGSSPKRAMSEEHFFDRQVLGSTSVTGQTNIASGLGNDSQVHITGGRSADASASAQGSLGMEAQGVDLHDEEMEEEPEALMIDPGLLEAEVEGPGGMDVDVEAVGEKPATEDILKMIRASFESDLHPDDIIYILPSTFLRSLIESTSSSSSSVIDIDLVPFIDAEQHDSPTGKLTNTRAVPGTAAEGGFRLKNGLEEFKWEDGKGGSVGVEAEKGGDSDEAEPKMVFVKAGCWKKLVAWYGRPKPPMGIKRTIKSDPQNGYLTIELNPPSFILHKTFPSSSSSASRTDDSETRPQSTTPIRIVVSAASQVSDLHLAAVQALAIDGGDAVPHDLQQMPPSRLWRLELDPSIVGKAQVEDEAAQTFRARSSRIDEDYDAPDGFAAAAESDTQRPSSTLLLPSHLLPICSARLMYTHPPTEEQADVDLGDALIEHGDVFAIEFGERAADGEITWMVAVNEAGLAQELPGGEPPDEQNGADVGVASAPPVYIEEPQKLPPLFSTGLAYTGTHREPAPSYEAESSKMGAAASSGIATRSRTGGEREKAVVRGLKGLNNLGNTCFMNSALQCLSNTAELNRYFLSGLHKQELNRSNPLGMGGKVADAFGNLIEGLWDPEPPTRSSSGYFGGYSNSFAPRDLKNIVGRFAPQFQGYGQQDTQELLAFLLDGLHEDLNRIDKKPYIEKPDWKDGGGDEELALFGKENWDGYKKRNDSVIVDLFQGQLQSTLTCPICTKASITLDPFMYLTVPLPVKTTKERVVYFVPANGDQRMKLTLQHTPNTTFAGLKKKIGDLVGVPANTLLATDEFGHHIYQYWKDDTLVLDTRSDDVLVFHQMITPIVQSEKAQGPLDPAAGLSIPVYTCNSNGRVQCRPFFIHLSQLEAKSPSAIKKAVALGYRALVDHDMETELFSDSKPMEGNDSTGDVAQDVTDLHIDDADAPVSDEASNGAALVSSSHESLQSDLPSSSEIPRSDLYELKFVPASDGEKRSSFGSRRCYFTGNVSSGYTLQEWVTKKKGMVNRMLNALHRHSDEDGESRLQLLDHGDLIAVQWDDKAAATYLGRDSEGRYRNPTEYVVTEDPAVQIERKKAEIAKKQGINLDDCLAEFSKEEVLGDNDLWYCPHCKEHRAATKRLEIYQVPDILVIALKRFGARGAGKINVSVDFPISALDLSSRTKSRQVGTALEAAGKDPEAYGIPAMDEPLIYDLYAVDNHFGGMGGGHYTAHAKNQDDGKWYYFDDSSVREVGEADLNGSSAYLLFYHRRSKRPRGAATALKVAEAESAASSMILDPALNPYKEHQVARTQGADGPSPSTSISSMSGTPDAIQDRDVSSLDEDLPVRRSGSGRLSDKVSHLWQGDDSSEYESTSRSADGRPYEEFDTISEITSQSMPLRSPGVDLVTLDGIPNAYASMTYGNRQDEARARATTPPRVSRLTAVDPVVHTLASTLSQPSRALTMDRVQKMNLDLYGTKRLIDRVASRRTIDTVNGVETLATAAPRYQLEMEEVVQAGWATLLRDTLPSEGYSLETIGSLGSLADSVGVHKSHTTVTLPKQKNSKSNHMRMDQPDILMFVQVLLNDPTIGQPQSYDIPIMVAEVKRANLPNLTKKGVLKALWYLFLARSAFGTTCAMYIGGASYIIFRVDTQDRIWASGSGWGSHTLNAVDFAAKVAETCDCMDTLPLKQGGEADTRLTQIAETISHLLVYGAAFPGCDPLEYRSLPGKAAQGSVRPSETWAVSMSELREHQQTVFDAVSTTSTGTAHSTSRSGGKTRSNTDPASGPGAPSRTPSGRGRQRTGTGSDRSSRSRRAPEQDAGSANRTRSKRPSGVESAAHVGDSGPTNTHTGGLPSPPNTEKKSERGRRAWDIRFTKAATHKVDVSHWTKTSSFAALQPDTAGIDGHHGDPESSASSATSFELDSHCNSILRRIVINTSSAL